MEKQQLTGAIVPIYIKRCPELTVYEKFMLEYLIQEDNYYYNQKGFYHSCVQFAGELCISKNTVFANLNSLEEKGFISTKKQKGRKATEFIINYDRIAELSKYSSYERQEKVVTLQPDNQQVKEKLIVEEKPAEVLIETRGLSNAVAPQIPQQEPKTEPVVEEEPSTDTIYQTEEEQPKIKVNPFVGQSPDTFPEYPSRLHYPEDKDRIEEVYKFLDDRANIAEQAEFEQFETEKLSDGAKDVVRQYIKPIDEDMDYVNDLRDVKGYYNICETTPQYLRAFADIFLQLVNENKEIDKNLQS